MQELKTSEQPIFETEINWPYLSTLWIIKRNPSYHKHASYWPEPIVIESDDIKLMQLFHRYLKGILHLVSVAEDKLVLGKQGKSIAIYHIVSKDTLKVKSLLESKSFDSSLLKKLRSPELDVIEHHIKNFCKIYKLLKEGTEEPIMRIEAMEIPIHQPRKYQKTV